MFNHRIPRRSLLAGLVWMAALLSGCSHMVVDESGQRHVIGFVVLTLPPVDTATLGAEAIRTRTLGVSLTRSPIGGALVLGYSDTTLTAIRNHSLVPLAATPAPPTPP